MTADAELRALEVWRHVAAAATEHEQDLIAAGLVSIRRAVAEGLDVRVGGRREDADALRGEAARSLRQLALRTGLVECYFERIEQLIADIQNDPLAVRVPGGMATIGWPSLARRRGGASSADGALRGWLVRQVDSILPTNTRPRYKTIAALVTFVGADCSPELARSTVKNGRT